METDYTRKFSIRYEKDPEIKEVLTSVYNSLQEKGYNPINQIVGYILSEDPTYITNYNNARALIRKLDRYDLLQELVKQYLMDCVLIARIRCLRYAQTSFFCLCCFCNIPQGTALVCLAHTNTRRRSI